MSASIRDLYFGWNELTHAADCKRPVWEAATRTEERHWPRYGGPEHACPNGDECSHSSTYTRTEVRLVCRSCDVVRVMAGEEHSFGSTTTAHYGYGSAPERKAGLLLWPSGPLFQESGEPPWEYLVTRPGVTRVTEDDVVAAIAQSRGKRGAKQWSAVAVRHADGPYGLRPFRYARANTGLRSVGAAAKWIAAQLQAAEGGDVR